MLDLDNLFATQSSGATVPSLSGGVNQSESLAPSSLDDISQHHSRCEVGHSGHSALTPVLAQVCPPKPLQHKALDELGTLGTLGTVDIQEGEDRALKNSPGEGAARDQFALHPAAIILVLAYCKKVRASNDERISALLHLETMKPGDQVKCWHLSCIEVGIKPWEVLTLPAPSSGLDCTMCKHLTTRQITSHNERRRFDWACGLGYLILETGRATERIWIAPPECNNYQRWVPSAQI